MPSSLHWGSEDETVVGSVAPSQVFDDPQPAAPDPSHEHDWHAFEEIVVDLRSLTQRLAPLDAELTVEPPGDGPAQVRTPESRELYDRIRALQNESGLSLATALHWPVQRLDYEEEDTDQPDDLLVVGPCPYCSPGLGGIFSDYSDSTVSTDYLTDEDPPRHRLETRRPYLWRWPDSDDWHYCDVDYSPSADQSSYSTGSPLSPRYPSQEPSPPHGHPANTAGGFRIVLRPPRWQPPELRTNTPSASVSSSIRRSSAASGQPPSDLASDQRDYGLRLRVRLRGTPRSHPA